MLILLDIDGVMVPAKPWSAPTNLEDGFPMFSLKSIHALNHILSQRKADIVLSTSHRDRFSLDEWTQIFRKRGIEANIIGKLSTHHSEPLQSRASEIRAWYMDYTGEDDFIIIDDDKTLNSLSQYLKARVVQTNPMVGLNASHVIKAVELLDTPVERV